jgi:sulfur-oxidizing protein SoxZ
MADPMRVRATEAGGVVDVKILMKHDMETIPQWFISTVTVQAQGKNVFMGEFGPAVSKDPFLNFKYKGAKGEKVTVTWVDNRGAKRTDEATVS